MESIALGSQWAKAGLCFPAAPAEGSGGPPAAGRSGGAAACAELHQEAPGGHGDAQLQRHPWVLSTSLHIIYIYNIHII